MEVYLRKLAMEVNGIENYTEIKVRKHDEGLRYYLVPKRSIERVVNLFDRFKILYDIQSPDAKEIEGFVEEKPLISSIYDEEMCAINCNIEPGDFCKLVLYVNEHKDELIFLCFFKNSELPEFKELMTEKAKEGLDDWVIVALEEYMKHLLDMETGERMNAIYDFMNHGNLKMFLNQYTDTVQKFIYGNVSKRTRAAIENQGE